MPRVQKKMVDVLSKEEIARILGSLNPRTAGGSRDHAIVMALLDCGLRASEILTLKDRDVDLEEGILRVVGKGNKERLVPIGSRVTKAFVQYRQIFRPEPASPSVDTFFLDQDGRPMSFDALKSMLQRLGRRTEVPRLHAHLLRHTFATMFLVNGGDVFTLQRILGHTTLTMVNHYVHMAGAEVALRYRFVLADGQHERHAEARAEGSGSRCRPSSPAGRFKPAKHQMTPSGVTLVPWPGLWLRIWLSKARARRHLHIWLERPGASHCPLANPSLIQTHLFLLTCPWISNLPTVNPISPRSQVRLPRCKRTDKPPQFVLTDRDMDILRDVLRMRYLDREQVQRLRFGPRSASACKRRLTLLYHHRYLDRVLVPSAPPSGSARALYCLDRRGAHVLALADGTGVRNVDWRRQDNDKDSFFLALLRDCNDVWISVIEACDGQGWTLTWTDERELRRTLTRQRLPATAGSRAALLVIPDGQFTIDDGGDRYSFALELDRGTVEEKRIREKVCGYGEWMTSGAYRRRYRDDSLRVLFVVSGRNPRERVERLKRWTEAEGGRSLFWFTEQETLDRSDPLCDPIWKVGGTATREALLPVAALPVTRGARRLPAVR